MIRGFFPSMASHPYLGVGINLPLFNIGWTPVPFLVDTGAAFTCVHPSDAKRLLGLTTAQLDPENWDADKIQAGYGVGGFVRYFETEAYFGFADDRADPTMYQAKIRIAEVRPDNRSMPSLLGWDLLQHFRMMLDGKARTLELEWLG